MNRQWRLIPVLVWVLLIGLVTPTGASADPVVASGAQVSVAAAVSSPDQLVAWGDGLVGQLGDGRRFGQLTPGRVTAGSMAGRTIDALYAGYLGTCATSSGTLICWGQDAQLLGDQRSPAETPTTVPIEVNPRGVFTGKTITAVGLGGSHLCAVASDDLYCWGGVAVQPFVANQTRDLTVPIGREVLAGRTITALAVGGNHTCLIADGQLFCFGVNDDGQLGDGTQDTRYQLAPVGGLLAGKRVTSVSAGDRTTCAIADGAAYCWGAGGGMLGDGTRDDYRSTPTPVTPVAFSGAPVTQISVGGTTVCAVAGGRPYCWGLGGSGQLGAGPDVVLSFVPVAVSTAGALAGHRVTSVAAGKTSACAEADGQISCWGSNTSGQLGVGVHNGKTVLVSAVPLPVDADAAWGSASVTSVAVPGATACALVRGQAWCWGDNDNNLTGDPRSLRAVVPFRVPLTGALSTAQISQVAAGDFHSCMIADDVPYCWGAIATTSPELFSAVPYPVDTKGVLAGRTLTDLGSGSGMSCVLADGLPYCWGLGAFRGTITQNTVPDPTPVAIDTTAFGGRRMTALSVGGQTACGVVAGQVYCWGAGSAALGRRVAGVSAVPALVDGTDALRGRTTTSVAVGQQHVCAIADGRPYCWGTDDHGSAGGADAVQGPQPIDVSGALAGHAVSAIAVGVTNSCVVADGRLYCWGGSPGQIGAPAGGTGTVPGAVDTSLGLGDRIVTGVSLGPSTGCVVADSRAFCWGATPTGYPLSPEPFDLSGATGGTAVAAVSVGGAHALALARPEPGTARPIGSVDTGVLVGPSFRMDGWALDPDTAARPVSVDVYDRRPDGSSVGVRFTADGDRPDIATVFPGAGAAHGFSATIGLTVAGRHQVCAFAIDSEVADAHTLIGCRTVDLPGPVGAVDVVRPTAPGQLTVQGWAAQPGATDVDTELHVYVYAPNGVARGYSGIMTGSARPDVTAALGWPNGRTGFTTEVTVDQTGTYGVCVYGIGTTRANGTTLPAAVSLLGCRTVEVRNAFGSLDAVDASNGELHLTGWALDPNAAGEPVQIHVYDFGPTGTVGTPGFSTGSARPDVVAVYPGIGDRPGFDLTVPTTGAGNHTVCAFAITTGGGTGNTLLGCREVRVG